MINDLNNDNIEISFSNKGLLPWEGGCLWERDGDKPLIQLRTVFQKKERFLGIYTKQEILDHEMVHAKRLGYKEPIFEEIIAYQTSKSFFRRFFGPIFRNSKEAIIFAIFSSILFFLWLPFAAYTIFLLSRLAFYQRIFSKLKKIYIKQYGSFENSFIHIIPLKDQEILNIARTNADAF